MSGIIPSYTAGQQDGIVHLYLMILFTRCCPNGIVFPMVKSCRFPQGKSAATESRYPTLINYKMHAEFFHVSVIHRIMTWTTRIFTVRTWSFLYVRGHTDSEPVQHYFDSHKRSPLFYCAPGGFRRVFWSGVRCSTNWATPSTGIISVYPVLYPYIQRW